MNTRPNQFQVYNAFLSGAPLGVSETQIDSIQTAVSRLILTRNEKKQSVRPEGLVYKIKREDAPLYVKGYETLEGRKQACQREMEVNQPNAPGVYLGVDEIRYDPATGAIKLSSDPNDGEIIEYALRMKRLDPSNNLLNMLTVGRDVSMLMKPIANAIFQMHQRAEIKRQLEPERHHLLLASSEAYLGLVRDVCEVAQKAQFDWPAAEVSDLMMASLLKYAPEIRQRCKDGQVRQCHADLHGGNIWFDEGRPVFLDGIEFNDNFTTIDVWQDLARFSADLMLRGYETDAIAVLREYFSVASEPVNPALMNFYMGDRMLVSGLIALFGAVEIQNALVKDPHHSQHQQELSRELRIARRAVNLSKEMFGYALRGEAGKLIL